MLHALLLAGYIAAQSADVGTSLALNGPGYYEVNRLVPSRPVPFVALKTGITATVAIAGWKARKTHPKLAKVVFIAGMASGAIAASINARTLAQRGRR